MKKFLAFLMAFTMLLSLSACNFSNILQTISDTPHAHKGKIAIITGTSMQADGEFSAAAKMKQKYGDRIVLSTYPDSFSDNPDITIDTIKKLASNSDIKALIFIQAVAGSGAALEKAKQINPDLLVIAGLPGEDPEIISSVCDIVLSMDLINGTGSNVPLQAKKMGAKTLVHYSFPRHMSLSYVSDCRDIMKKTCEEIGIKFVDATAPDPTDKSGIPAVQKFIAENVPKQIEQYGKDTAFYSTNRATQVPLIKSVIANGAIYPQQHSPSALHDFPEALGIEIPPDKSFDTDFVVSAITDKVSELNMTGRLSTWSVPIVLTIIEGSTDYAFKYIDGELTQKLDEKVLIECLKLAADGNLTVKNFSTNNAEYPNYFTLSSDYVTF
ncbi:MAG: DUF3798 domain-containing protein [Oscillospiraceae bacterium]